LTIGLNTSDPRQKLLTKNIFNISYID